MALREVDAFCGALQAEGVGAQDGVLLPTRAGDGFLQQPQAVEQQQEFPGRFHLQVPHGGGGGGIEIGFWRKNAQSAKLRRGMRAGFYQIIVAVFQGDLHGGDLVGFVEAREVAKAFAGGHAAQQFGGGLRVVVGFARGQRAGSQGQGLRVIAQAFSDGSGQVVGQTGRALLQEQPRVCCGEHIQGLNGGGVVFQRVGHVVVAGGQQGAGIFRQGLLKRAQGNGGPHVIDHYQQRAVAAQERLDRVGGEFGVGEEGVGLRVGFVGVGRHALQDRRNPVGRAPGGANVQPHDAAGILRAVAVCVHGRQRRLADAGLPAQRGGGAARDEGHALGSREPRAQFVQFGGAPYGGAG